MPDDIMPDDCNIIAIARSTNLVIELDVISKLVI